VDLNGNQTFLKVAIALCGVILLVALWKVFKRGRQALFLVGAVVSFGLMLSALDRAWPMPAVYLLGFLCALLLVLDGRSRTAGRS